MKTYLWLMLIATFPVVLSALIYLAERTKAVSRIPYIVKQVIIGVLFGALAILGTEFGVKTDGAVINARSLTMFRAAAAIL